MKQLTEKERDKVCTLAEPFLPAGGNPFDPKEIKALRKKFAGYVANADKVLAIIAPPPKPRVEKPKQ